MTRYILILMSAVLLTGCGFHLRGSVEISESFLPVFVKDNRGSQIKPALLQSLDENRIARVDDESSANLVLIINKEQFKRRVLSVGGAGKVQEFALQYLVGFSAVNGEGEVVIAQQDIRLERDLRFDENAVLAKAQEETQRHQDMVKDAARQILRRLQSLSVSNVKNKTNIKANAPVQMPEADSTKVSTSASTKSHAK